MCIKINLQQMRYFYIILLLLSFCFYSCDRNQTSEAEEELLSALMPDMDSIRFTNQQADSLAFRLTHHYGENSNFEVTADSLILLPRDDDWQQAPSVIYKGDIIVVAVCRHVSIYEADSLSADTVWVKVANSKNLMGWVDEQTLLRSVVPDEPISKIIIIIKSVHAVIGKSWIVGLFILLFVLLWRKNKYYRDFLTGITSFYPILLLINAAVFAVFLKTLENTTPEFLQEYYFHPTLNPLTLPFMMSVLVLLVWVNTILFIAEFLDLYGKIGLLKSLAYIIIHFTLMVVVFEFFLLVSSPVFRWIFLISFIALLLYVYRRYMRCRYVCGNCGFSLTSLGTCPKCGAVNE